MSALAGFTAVAGALLWALDASSQAYARTNADLVRQMDELIESHQRYKGSPRLVYLGDSLSMPGKGRPGPTELRTLLQRTGHINVNGLVNVSAAGFTAHSHYFLSERLTELRADRFIIGVNLGWFSRDPSQQQTELAGFLPISRWPEVATLPLYEAGLSADSLVVFRALVALDVLEVWQRVQAEQVRAEAGLERLARWLQDTLGQSSPAPKYVVSSHRAQRLTRGDRPTHEGARHRWGPILDGLEEEDPTLQMLDAVLRRLRTTGARVLVVVSPTNVDALESLGLYDRDAFGASLAEIQRTATSNGADFMDLHDLFGDAAFRDPTDHLRLAEKPSAGQALAAQLVLWSVGNADWNRRSQVAPELRRETGDQRRTGAAKSP